MFNISNYIERISETLIKFLLISDLPFIAFSSGVRTIFSSITPTITFDFPAKIDSTANTPIREAKTRSKQLGDPPRCMCPKTETRTS